MDATPALATRGLTKRYADVTAVESLDLDVRVGEIYGLLGPNGAGKTTTIRMLAGLLAPTAGTVHVMGQALSPARSDARRLVGLCPQENVLYPELTARENLEYVAGLYGVPRVERRRRAHELLDSLGLAEKRDARAAKLSGGMKRRLTLATALVHDPPVVVLDEPEAGLDPQTRVMLRDYVRTLRGERTVVLTSHNMDEVERLADRVAIIDQGRLLALDTPSALKARHAKGDAIEIALADAAAAPRLADALREAMPGPVGVQGATITLRGREMGPRLATVLEVVAKAGAETTDVRYRPATLEDVFIELTGRGLRE